MRDAPPCHAPEIVIAGGGADASAAGRPQASATLIMTSSSVVARATLRGARRTVPSTGARILRPICAAGTCPHDRAHHLYVMQQQHHARRTILSDPPTPRRRTRRSSRDLTKD